MSPPSGSRRADAPRHRRHRRRRRRPGRIVGVAVVVTVVIAAVAVTLVVSSGGGGQRARHPQLTSTLTTARVRTWAGTTGAAVTGALAADYQALISQASGGSGAEACSALGVEVGYARTVAGPPDAALRRAWGSDLRLVSSGAAGCREEVGTDDQRTGSGPVEKVAQGVGQLLALEQAARRGRPAVGR
jgi:hypothetical protein